VKDRATHLVARKPLWLAEAPFRHVIGDSFQILDEGAYANAAKGPTRFLRGLQLPATSCVLDTMDLTPVFNELLGKHNAPQTRKKYSVTDIDGFLKEAYRIVSGTSNCLCPVWQLTCQKSHITSLHNELKDVRQAYLSTAQARKSHIRTGQQQQRFLTDRDREEIDANAKQMLRELNASIRALEEAETLRRETESALIRKKFVGRLGALGSWAAGGGPSNESKTAEHAAADGQAKDIGIHRDGVLWFLRQKLQLCGRTQADMMESRLTREMEKNRSVLAKAGGGGAMPELTGFYETTQLGNKSKSTARSGPPEDEPAPYIASELTEEQIQMFEKGNQDMVQHYNSTLDKVRYERRSRPGGGRDISDILQDGGEVADRDLGIADAAGRQLGHAVGAHRTAGDRVGEHDGERRQRQQAAQGGDQEAKRSAVHVLRVCGSVRLLDRLGSDILNNKKRMMMSRENKSPQPPVSDM
jgi:hypothetical protein